MACVIVPGVEAIVVKVIEKKKEKKEKKSGLTAQAGMPISGKIKYLSNMLWGGTILLTIEHIWHGEIQFFPPFLTAMSTKADTMIMVEEIRTVGVGMAILVTLAWGVVIGVQEIMHRRKEKAKCI